MKILIISGDKVLANAITDGLADVRYEVHYAADGEAGLDLAMERQFDLLVLDWALPNKNGLTILRTLRRYKNLVPVLMVTSDYSVSEIVQSLDCGANDCVTRPFEIYVLIARMKALIRRSRWDLCAEVSYDGIHSDIIT